MNDLPLIVLARGVDSCGCEHNEQRATAARGTLRIGALELHTIERLDGYVRLPAGEWVLECARMKSSRARALVVVDDAEPNADVGPGLRRALDAGRIYIHPANEPCQIQGCIAPGVHRGDRGVLRSVDALVALFGAIGGWDEGRQARLRVVDGGV